MFGKIPGLGRKWSRWLYYDPRPEERVRPAGVVTQKFNWTDGCIAVSNSDMNEIWDAVEVGTPIELKP